MNEIVFLVEDAEEGGFVAHVRDLAIFTQADSLVALRYAVRDAVDCHFDDDEARPGRIRLRMPDGEMVDA